MRIAVTGTQEFLSPEQERKVRFVLDMYGGNHVLIHGGHTGVDSYCSLLAREKGWEIVEVGAHWSPGKKIGPIRSRRIIEEFSPDILLAFLTPCSHASHHCIYLARKNGIPVVETKI